MASNQQRPAQPNLDLRLLAALLPRVMLDHARIMAYIQRAQAMLAETPEGRALLDEILGYIHAVHPDSAQR